MFNWRKRYENQDRVKGTFTPKQESKKPIQAVIMTHINTIFNCGEFDNYVKIFNDYLVKVTN